MLNRRQLLRLLPLSLLLGGSFQRRSAVARETPEEVVTRLFRVVQQGDWDQLLGAMAGDDLKRMRHSLEAIEKLSGAESIGAMVDAVQIEPEPYGELRGLLDELTELVEVEEAKQTPDKPADEDDPSVAVRKVVDAGLPRSRRQSDRDFLVAYLGRFEPFLEQLRETELVIVGSVVSNDERVHVVYRLADVFSLRPSVMTLTYSELGWCAAGGDQLNMVAMLAAAQQTMPDLAVRVVGELTEAGLTHFLCEAECSIGADSFHPAFCCTWFTKDASVPEMRARGYRALIERLQTDLKLAWKQALELWPKNG